MHYFRKSFQLWIALTFLVGLLGPAAFPASGGTPKVDPLLIQLAAKEPERRVAVIVQEAAGDPRLADRIVNLGGEVTRDLHIINAFAAEMTASAACRLATSSIVRWISLDAPVESAGRGKSGGSDDEGGKSTDQPLPQNYFLDTLGVRQVWDMGFQGQGIAVVVVDSGVTRDKDFSQHRLVEQEKFNPDAVSIHDGYGHGTHVAGIIAGNGTDSDGLYMGIAPMVDLIGLKISNNEGMAYESDVVAALQWVLDNKDAYNIRVVNMSVNSTAEISYHASPLDAAAEILWFNGIVVVVSAGNKGAENGFNTTNAPPANDPFLITVGAGDEHATSNPSDDTLASFSARGRTMDGFDKPEIIAPGKDIISVLATTSAWSARPDRVVRIGSKAEYFRLSGTSMAAPMVSGAVALLLQAEPNLTPDQVKYRLTFASQTVGGEPYLDVFALITTSTTESANTGIQASQLLWSGNDPLAWNSVNWNSVNWNSVAWNSVNWNSVNWNSVNWNSVSWND